MPIASERIRQERVNGDLHNIEYLQKVSEGSALVQLEDEFVTAFLSLARIKAVAKSAGHFNLFEAAYQAENYVIRAVSLWEDVAPFE
jgi:hypothetical protein